MLRWPYNQRLDYMRCLFISSFLFWTFQEYRLSINSDRIPSMIIFCEVSTYWKWTLGKNDTIDWKEIWLNKVSDHFCRPKVINVNTSVSRGSCKQAHFLADKYWSYHFWMIVQLSQFYPRIHSCLDCTVCRSVTPDNHLTTLCSCYESSIFFIACNCCYCCTVFSKFIINAIFDWRKYNLSIPVAAFYYITTLAYNCHWEIKSFRTTVNLVHTVYLLVTIELRLLITA